MTSFSFDKYITCRVFVPSVEKLIKGHSVCDDKAFDVFHFGLTPRPGWWSKWGKNADLRRKRTELCVSAAKSCSHMTRKDSKMPLRKTFCLYSSTVAVRNSCHVKLWPRKNVQRGLKLVKRFGSSVKMGINNFCDFPLCGLSFSLFYFCSSNPCFPSPWSGFPECTECPYLCPCKHEGEPAAEAKFLYRSQADRSHHMLLSGMTAQ